MKNNILIVTTQAENAGAQKAALKLYTYMEEENVDVTTSYLYSLDHNYIESIKKSYKTRVFMSSRKFHKLLSLFMIRKLVKRDNISHVISYTHWSNIIVPLLLLGSDVKMIANKRGGLWKYPLLRFFEGIILNSFLVNKVICVSQGTYTEALEHQNVPLTKLYHIPNGIDLVARESQNKMKYSYGDCFNFLFVGRLHEQKGIEFLIKGFNVFLQESNYLNAKLTIVGGGDLSEELNTFIKKNNMSSFIDIVGSVSQVKGYYLNSHVLVSSSLWEGFPNVLLEAASYSLPIVATDINGSNELIKDRVNGYLFMPSDSKSLAAALKYSFEHYTEMKKYSVKLLNTLDEKYSHRKIKESYKTVLFDD